MNHKHAKNTTVAENECISPNEPRLEAHTAPYQHKWKRLDQARQQGKLHYARKLPEAVDTERNFGWRGMWRRRREPYNAVRAKQGEARQGWGGEKSHVICSGIRQGPPFARGEIAEK